MSQTSRPLSAIESQEVLRYWLSNLRAEEALNARPRAKAAGRSHSDQINLREPVRGQSYLKLGLSNSGPFLVQDKSTHELQLNGEARACFEDWLVQCYRHGDGESNVQQLVLFPALLLPRGELGGLLRFPVEAQWLTAGGTRFAPAGLRQRKRGAFGEVPTSLRLKCASAGEEGVPYFVDTRLLRENLGVHSEALDDFFQQLRGKERLNGHAMVALLCDLLLAEEECLSEEARRVRLAERPSAELPQDGLLRMLLAVVDRRLEAAGRRAKVYPVGLFVNAPQNRATFHVQRDLVSLLEPSGLEDAGEGPLTDYLRGEATAEAERFLWARWDSAGLTLAQRTAAQLALGSRLTSVQGPPGTGKTHLILNLCADAICRSMPDLASASPAGGTTLITSTNNRAVDNVLALLNQPGKLPLAARVGSRQLTEKLSAGHFQSIFRWLEAQPPVDSAALEEAHRQFHERRRVGGELWGGAIQQLELGSQVLALRRRIAALEVESDAASEGSLLKPEGPAEPGQALTRAGALARRLAALSGMAEPDGKASLVRIAAHAQQTMAEFVVPLEKALGYSLAFKLEAGAGGREEWEQLAEEALARVLDLQLSLQQRVAGRKAERDLAQLKQELEQKQGELGGTSGDGQPRKQEQEDELLELFRLAQNYRELWARHHRARILPALKEAQELCERSGSLRRLLEARQGAGPTLRALLPIWTCTLLSLPNHFPPNASCFERVIIDEAGQCHPAYPVSALLRASSALFLGDVNQLQPVVSLSQEDERRLLGTLNLKMASAKLEAYRVFEGAASSAQSLSDRAVGKRPVLIDHFRCQRDIAQISEELCGYGLVTHTPPASAGQTVPELVAPVLHAAVSGDVQRSLSSYVNTAEVRAVLSWVRRLLSCGLSPAELGILTPFRGQLFELQRACRGAGLPVEATGGSPEEGLSEQGQLLAPLREDGVALGTVHRFQGGERRIILFSTVATDSRSGRFLNERVNLVNVAASRAREHLVTIGHTETLRAGACTAGLVRAAVQVEV